MQDSIRVNVVPLRDDVELPKYAHAGDAGLDIRCAERVLLGVHERKVVPTGIAVEIPEGYAGFLLPRSGLAVRHGLSIVNSPGLIDSGYRGEIKGILINEGEYPISFEAGERIMQLVIMPVPNVRLFALDSLTETERGADGFGSSGTE